jgi:hypothetical protein
VNDRRLEEWLALSQRILAAEPAERARQLVDAEGRRRELQASLEAEPPADSPSLELARALRESEDAIQKLGRELSHEIAGQLEELRRVRSATQGYRPTLGSRPAFVSRSV